MPQITISLAGFAALLIIASGVVQIVTPHNSKWAMWLALVGGLCLGGAGTLGQMLQTVTGSASQLTDKVTATVFGVSGLGTIVVLSVGFYWFYHRTIYSGGGNGIQAGQRTKSKHLSRVLQLVALCTCIALGVTVVTTASFVQEFLQNAAAQVSAQVGTFTN